jgi:hypothetical protein
LHGGRPDLYVIVNGRINSGFEVVPNQVEAIAAQSFGTMDRIGTKVVLAETFNVASRENFSFHLSYVGRDLPNGGGTGFETGAATVKRAGTVIGASALPPFAPC